jgi:hypothetical protein
MSKIWAALIASALAASAVSQAPPVIYAAVKVVKDQQITLKAWGSGTIAETDEMAFVGTHSIRVSTRNYFQGGLITLGAPVDLSKSFADKNNLLRFMVSVSTASTTYGGGGAGVGKGGGPGGISGAGAPGGGRTGGGGGTGVRGGGGRTGGGGAAGGRQGGGAPGGIMGPGGPGGKSGAGAASTADIPPLKMVRLLVLTTDGLRSEAYIPVPTASPKEGSFVGLAVPLQAIAGFDRTNKVVKEIGLAGDSVSTFYVGDIAIVNDATPISGDTNYHDLNLALGDEIELGAIGYGGSSVLVYTWNFGTSGNAALPDAEGQWVTRKFRKPGDFVVTLTISDKFGLKKPYTTTINVRVNP